jgi:hypothetical protein
MLRVDRAPAYGMMNLELNTRLRSTPRSMRHPVSRTGILKPCCPVFDDAIGNRHSLTIGHRGDSVTATAATADEFGATLATAVCEQPPRRSSHHFYRRDRGLTYSQFRTIALCSPHAGGVAHGPQPSPSCVTALALGVRATTTARLPRTSESRRRPLRE